MIDGFFVNGGINQDVVFPRVAKKGKTVRQSKLKEYFFVKKM